MSDSDDLDWLYDTLSSPLRRQLKKPKTGIETQPIAKCPLVELPDEHLTTQIKPEPNATCPLIDLLDEPSPVRAIRPEPKAKCPLLELLDEFSPVRAIRPSSSSVKPGVLAAVHMGSSSSSSTLPPLHVSRPSRSELWEQTSSTTDMQTALNAMQQLMEQDEDENEAERKHGKVALPPSPQAAQCTDKGVQWRHILEPVMNWETLSRIEDVLHDKIMK